MSEETEITHNQNSSGRCARNGNQSKRDFQIQSKNVSASARTQLNDFTSHLYKLPSGCYANIVPQDLYDILLEKKGKNDSFKNIAAFATIHSIEQFITKIQEITSAHWRLPNYKELLAFLSKDERSGILGSSYFVYFNSEEGTLHSFQEFGGEKGEIRNGDLYFNKYKFVLVYDSTVVECIQTLEPHNHCYSNNTSINVERKGHWYYGLCPVKSNGRWGVIDVKGNIVIPYNFDAEPKIGMMSYAGPGPMIPEELRIKYNKGSIIGYYRIKGNNKVEHEIALTEERWRWRAELS